MEKNFHQLFPSNMKFLFVLLIVALLFCNVNCQQKTCETTSTLGFCGRAQEEDDEEEK
jgi:hypothetical protein